VRPAAVPGMVVPGNYPRHLHLPLKHADQDPCGDVNGIAIARLFEEARYQVRTSIDADEARDPHVGFVLARVRIDIVAPVRYPGSVDVGIGIAGSGRTSLRYASAMFQDGRLVALSDATVAVRDRRTGAGYALTPRFHAALAPMLLMAHPASSG
jgi:acyl-CoA thioester hydrolase